MNTPNSKFEFHWAGGIENTFIPQEAAGLRALEEYALTQHYAHWRADLKRAAALGISKLRWGVPWYKVEPQPGQFDWSWTDEVIPYMVETLGIDPILDMVHYGTPLWLEGSFVNPHYADFVARYAGEVASRYGHLVKWYTPLNEPTVNADFAGRKALWPPYLEGDRGFVAVMLAIASGIQKTVRTIAAIQPHASFVAVEAMMLHRFQTERARRFAQLEFHKDFLCWDLVRGAVDEAHPLYAWLLSNGAGAETLDRLRAARVEQTILGVNFYPWSAQMVDVRADDTPVFNGDSATGSQLAGLLRAVHAYSGKPLFVTETSAPGPVTVRRQWMSDTITAVRTVRGEGLPVLGYTWFPLFSMIEWDYRTSEKPVEEHLLHLGLWNARFNRRGTLVRHPTSLVAAYREQIKQGVPVMTHRFRLERDSMGDMQVPVTALYGASTQRAVLNFPVSELRLQRSFIRALALIKACAAEVNAENGDLHEMTAAAISLAATRVSQGTYDEQFVVDVFQTGSGTSTNMNANEVIANLAIEILGGTRGDRTLVHPNDHVNMGMSSNDAIPTATHIAAVVELTYNLLPVLDQLQKALEAKAAQFAGVIKTGRTHLNDATPITLGQEFHGYAGQIERAIARIANARDRLCEVALGGTAVGTGINTRADFAARVLAKVSAHIGINVHETGNHFQAQSTLDEVVYCAGTLKVLAATLMKIANDIRFLGSGPRAGFGELALPEVQPGSSIMPGKVNPVIAESVCQVAAQVYGNEAAIALAGQSGNFELNVMQPVAAYNLLQAIELLAHASDNFRRQCIIGLTATAAGPKGVEEGLSLCTALVPVIGYDQAAKLAKIAHREGRTIRAVALDHTSLTEEELGRLLDPFTMIHPEAVAVVADTVATGNQEDTGEPPAEAPDDAGSNVLSFAQFKVLGKPRSSGRPFLIALTGGISVGKSVVGSALEDFGVPVLDTDHLGHELLSSPNPVYAAVLKRFNGAGDLVSFPGQAINRRLLGAKVFGKPEELAALNAIMHPAILNLLDERLAKFGPRDIVAVQVPLLHESGLAELFDESWAIITTDALQLKWLMARDHISEEAARKRIAAQLPQDEKARLCRRIIVNSGTRESTRIQVGTQLQNVYALVA